MWLQLLLLFFLCPLVLSLLQSCPDGSHALCGSMIHAAALWHSSAPSLHLPLILFSFFIDDIATVFFQLLFLLLLRSFFCL
jgi:hypothetical protein